jgi:hypothetical protein
MAVDRERLEQWTNWIFYTAIGAVLVAAWLVPGDMDVLTLGFVPIVGCLMGFGKSPTSHMRNARNLLVVGIVALAVAVAIHYDKTMEDIQNILQFSKSALGKSSSMDNLWLVLGYGALSGALIRLVRAALERIASALDDA